MMQVQRPARAAPILSPATAKEIVEAFNQEYASSSSDSPDSLYSNGSPTLPEQSFEYDEEERISHHDEEDYESLMAQTDDEWGAPAWGRWPESTAAGPGWTRGIDSASIISLSPHGSQTHSMNSRRGSLAKSKMSLNDSRRDSDPSLLGFNLTPQRRRSSLKSGSLSRRRSSALSIGSYNDSIEDARLRRMASLDVLGRRFSEVVEVTVPSDEEDHTAMARAAISRWSPYSASSADDDTDSEIHTAPYFPTPEMPRTIPNILSNFPLSSVAAADGTPASTYSDISAAVSPAMMSRRLPFPLHQPSAHFVATPPPPAQPSSLLREKVRPKLGRFSTNWEPAPRSAGVPLGASAPRPRLGRSVSTPFFGAGPSGQEAAAFLRKRAAGAFPLARPVPLGISPLRESLRRQSIASEGPESRRQSLADCPSRRQSLADLKEGRRTSITDGASILADRRASLIKEGGLRRKSTDARRGSAASRKGSIASLAMSLSNIEMRRDSGSSKYSRKSSVVSISEYGYLAPQIMIDEVPGSPKETPSPVGTTRLRKNAPAAIVIPAYTFPASPSPPLQTPRQFNPIDAFLGRNVATPTPGTFASMFPIHDPSPTDDGTTPPGYHETPRVSVMDRGRPVSSPEFADYLLPMPRVTSITGSPRSTRDGSNSGSSHISHVSEMVTPLAPPTAVVIPTAQSAIVRKAVPQISAEELRAEEILDEELRREKRGFAEVNLDRDGTTAQNNHDNEILKAVGNHRRTISVQPSPVMEKRPINRRQATLPVELEVASNGVIVKRRSQLSFHTPSPRSGSSSESSHEEKSPNINNKVIQKRSSVTFAEGASKDKSSRPVIHRASSFSRFFHSKSKTPTISAPMPMPISKPLRPSIRPISMDSGSSGSDRTLVEVREAFKKFSRESP